MTPQDSELRSQAPAPRFEDAATPATEAVVEAEDALALEAAEDAEVRWEGVLSSSE